MLPPAGVDPAVWRALPPEVRREQQLILQQQQPQIQQLASSSSRSCAGGSKRGNSSGGSGKGKRPKLEASGGQTLTRFFRPGGKLGQD